jgi:membrane protein YdbS with pleckstrin-like domain
LSRPVVSQQDQLQKLAKRQPNVCTRIYNDSLLLTRWVAAACLWLHVVTPTVTIVTVGVTIVTVGVTIVTVGVTIMRLRHCRLHLELGDCSAMLLTPITVIIRPFQVVAECTCVRR